MIYNGDHDGEYDLKKKKKMARRKKREKEREKKYNSLDRTSNGKHRGELQIWIINRATQWAGREARESLWNIYELIVWEPSKY